MKFQAIADKLGCTVRHRSSGFDTVEIKNVVVSDLMSDALITEKESPILVSSLATVQTVRTADIIGALGILLVNGKRCDSPMVDLARETDISLLETRTDKFEACLALGKLLCR